jgi:hypothetical protein
MTPRASSSAPIPESHRRRREGRSAHGTRRVNAIRFCEARRSRRSSAPRSRETGKGLVIRCSPAFSPLRMARDGSNSPRFAPRTGHLFRISKAVVSVLSDGLRTRIRGGCCSSQREQWCAGRVERSRFIARTCPVAGRLRAGRSVGPSRPRRRVYESPHFAAGPPLRGRPLLPGRAVPGRLMTSAPSSSRRSLAARLTRACATPARHWAARHSPLRTTCPSKR